MPLLPFSRPLRLLNDTCPRSTFCCLFQAYKNGLYGAKYAWFATYWYSSDWWTEAEVDTDCTKTELLRAIDGIFYTGMTYINPAVDERGLAGVSYSELRQMYLQLTNGKELEGSRQIPSYYDSLWTVAVALDSTVKTLREIGNLTNTMNMISKQLLHDMRMIHSCAVDLVPYTPTAWDRCSSRLCDTRGRCSVATVEAITLYPDNNALQLDQSGTLFQNWYDMLLQLCDIGRLSCSQACRCRGSIWTLRSSISRVIYRSLSDNGNSFYNISYHALWIVFHF